MDVRAGASTPLAIMFVVLLAGCGVRSVSAATTIADGDAPGPSRRGTALTADDATPALVSTLKVYKFQPSADPSRYDTERDSRTLEMLTHIDFSKTVVVSIDLWDNVAPDPVMANARAVIDLARKHRIKIVHAPSTSIADIDPLVRATEHYPDEWVVSGLDHAEFDQFLHDYAIENILYVGFNNAWCVFWKPLGMDLQHERTPDENLILVKDATDSWGSRYWTNEWANNAAEQKFQSTTIADLATALSEDVAVQPFVDTNLADEPYAIDTGFGGGGDPRRMALVLVNPWHAHENDGWEARLKANNAEHLAPLLDVARQNGMAVAFVTNKRAIDPIVAARHGEPVLTTKAALWEYLASYRPRELADAPLSERFDGASYVDLGNAARFRSPAFTFEARVRSENPVGNRKLVSFYESIGTPYAAYQIKAGDDGRTLQYQYFAGGGWSTVSAPDYFTPGNTVELAVTHSATNEVRIYRDGTLVVAQQMDEALDYSNVVSLRIGARGDKDVWHGTISNVRLWSVARDDATVRADAAGNVNDASPDLAGHWPLDERGGTVAHDASSFAAPGTLLRNTFVETVIFAGNLTNETDAFPPIDAWAFTAYVGGATDPWDWAKTPYASRLLEDCIVAFESPASLDGERFKHAILARAVGVYGGSRHQVTTGAAVAANLKNNPERPIRLTPDAAGTPPHGTIQFSATGGSGAEYRWSLARNGSGGSVDGAGVYVAGSIGDSIDVIQLVDSLGQVATRQVAVGPAARVSPDYARVPPGGSVAFAASGGSGAGYVWSLRSAGSGATIDRKSGAYTAGRTGNVTDVVVVTDSLGNTAERAVTVTGGIRAFPEARTVPPRGTLALSASGGSGAGFRWTLVSSPSGGSILPATGEYTAGRTPGVDDRVEVVDSLGNVLAVDVHVGPALTIAAPPEVAPREPVALAAAGGSGGGFAWSLAVNGSGAFIDPVTGAYSAGPVGGAEDVIAVVDALGNLTTRAIRVQPGVTVSSPAISVPPQGRRALSATGGGAGYAWSMRWSGSGGSVRVDGAYVAGPLGNSVDVVEVMDRFGNIATSAIAVGPGITISPAGLVVAPRGTATLTAAGGQGEGFRWKFARNASGGTIDPVTGVYRAGPNASATDLVIATDPLGNSALREVSVTGALTISPASSSVAAGARLSLVAAGGSGTGFQWALETNASGATLGADGAYVAGRTQGIDRVRVTDGNGNAATAQVNVAPPPRSGCSSGGGAGAGSLGIAGVLLAAWVARRRVARARP